MGRKPRKRSNAVFDVVGFDFGTKFGWAHLRVENGEVRLVASGMWDLSQGKHAGGGMRLLACERYVKHLLVTAKPSAVGYEAVGGHVQGGVHAAHLYGAFLGEVTKQCEKLEIPYAGFYPNTLKKVAAGHGHAKKFDVMQAVAERFGFPVKKFKSDDEADAIAAALAIIEDLHLAE